MLAFNYGNIDELYKKLDKSLEVYKNSKNPIHPKVKYRIELYTKIIEYAKTKHNSSNTLKRSEQG